MTCQVVVLKCLRKGHCTASSEISHIYTDSHVGIFMVAELFRFSTSIRSLNMIELSVNPYPTAFPYGNGMVLHFYQQQKSSTTKTVHIVINKRLKAYV